MTRLYPWKTRPRPHQVRAMKKLVKNGGGGLFAPMRSGLPIKRKLLWIGRAQCTSSMASNECSW